MLDISQLLGEKAPHPKAPKINQLSQEQLRNQRLMRLGNLTEIDHTIVDPNYNGIGPLPDKIMDLNQPNLQSELKKIAKNKHKKYVLKPLLLFYLSLHKYL